MEPNSLLPLISSCSTQKAMSFFEQKQKYDEHKANLNKCDKCNAIKIEANWEKLANFHMLKKMQCHVQHIWLIILDSLVMVG